MRSFLVGSRVIKRLHPIYTIRLDAAISQYSITGITYYIVSYRLYLYTYIFELLYEMSELKNKIITDIILPIAFVFVHRINHT